jgi:hypothetical protein
MYRSAGATDVPTSNVNDFAASNTGKHDPEANPAPHRPRWVSTDENTSPDAGYGTSASSVQNDNAPGCRLAANDAALAEAKLQGDPHVVGAFDTKLDVYTLRLFPDASSTSSTALVFAGTVTNVPAVFTSCDPGRIQTCDDVPPLVDGEPPGQAISTSGA